MITLCPFESRTHEAVRSQSWAIDLATHVQTCSHCSLIVELHTKFHHMAKSLPPGLPSSGSVWVLATWEKQRYERKKIRQRTAWISAATVGGSILIGVVGSFLFGGHPLVIWKQALVPLLGGWILWHVNQATLERISDVVVYP